MASPTLPVDIGFGRATKTLLKRLALKVFTFSRQIAEKKSDVALAEKSLLRLADHLPPCQPVNRK